VTLLRLTDLRGVECSQHKGAICAITSDC
jgi:hypothetical protein